MFSYTKRLIGYITVMEKGDTITIEGLPAGRLMSDIRRVWSTSKIEQYMFSKVTTSSIKFNRFFAVDFAFALESLLEKGSKSNRRAVRRILELLYTETWLRETREKHPDILNWELLETKYKFKPLEHQERFFKGYNELVPKFRLKGFLLGAAPGSGKAQPLNANIKVPGGWAKMGEMAVGTEVITPKGTITKVTGVYPQGELEIYRLTFSDGRVVEACGDHLWKVHLRNEEKKGYWHIRTTKEIMESSSFADKRAYIPLIDAEDSQPIDLPIDPYVFGVILGDGNISGKSVVISHPDEFIKEKVASRLGAGVKIGNIVADGTYSIIGDKDVCQTRDNPMVVALTGMGLMGTHSHTKSIPNEYVLGSRQQRLDLLNGLLDTDGYIDTQGTASFLSTSLDLAEKVQYLVRSLGGIASISPKTKFFTYKGEKKQGKLAYQVNIRHKYPEELFTLPRKKERANNNNQYAEKLKLRIESIEYIGKKQAQCISVEDSEHLYVTDQFVVTHNTHMGLMLATMLDADVVFCVVPKNSINKVWEDTIASAYKVPETYWLSNSDMPIQVGVKHYVVHYEALEKIVAFVQANRGTWKKPVVILDESHNLNELTSQRTQSFITLCKMLDCKHVLWASGTPLKAAGTEVAPLLMTIDDLFDQDAMNRFMGVFGKNASRALDILANRMGLITFKVDKAIVVGNKVDDQSISIKIPNGDDYTLDTIREQMRKFIEERLAYYKKHRQQYLDIYNECLAIFEKKIGDAHTKQQFQLYRNYISTIVKGYDPVTMKEMAFFCNQFELKTIMPTLPQHMKNDFKDCRSVVKYYELKVQGEALGRILGKLRSQCHVDMVPYSNLPDIVETAEKKTVIFTSYVEVVKATQELMVKEGFKPLVVYGETNKDLASIVSTFANDTDANPLIATYKSLSTAVPLVMANTVVLMNSPFRDYERQQATSRVDRLGQDTEVVIRTILLDTGDKPNISTRSDDILDWSKQQVEMIMGMKSVDLGMECFRDLVPDQDVQAKTAMPTWTNWTTKS